MSVCYYCSKDSDSICDAAHFIINHCLWFLWANHTNNDKICNATAIFVARVWYLEFSPICYNMVYICDKIDQVITLMSTNDCCDRRRRLESKLNTLPLNECLMDNASFGSIRRLMFTSLIDVLNVFERYMAYGVTITKPFMRVFYRSPVDSSQEGSVVWSFHFLCCQSEQSDVCNY